MYPKRESTHMLSTGEKAVSTPTARASRAIAAPISPISSGSHVAPWVTSSGKTVPPATAEWSASLLHEAGMPWALACMILRCSSLRASTRCLIVPVPASPYATWPTPFLPIFVSKCSPVPP